MDFNNDTCQQIHAHFAAVCFEETWQLLESASPDIQKLLSCAYAASYHTTHQSQVNLRDRISVNWLLTRAYLKAGLTEAADICATECYQLCQQHGIKGIERVKALEVLARVALLKNEVTQACYYKTKSLEHLNAIKDHIERKQYLECKRVLNGIDANPDRHAHCIIGG